MAASWASIHMVMQIRECAFIFNQGCQHTICILTAPLFKATQQHQATAHDRVWHVLSTELHQSDSELRA